MRAETPSAAGKVAAAPKLPPGGLVYALGPLAVCRATTKVPAPSRAATGGLPTASAAGVLQVLLPAGSLLVYTEVTPLALVCWVTLRMSPAPSIATEPGTAWMLHVPAAERMAVPEDPGAPHCSSAMPELLSRTWVCPTKYTEGTCVSPFTPGL